MRLKPGPNGLDITRLRRKLLSPSRRLKRRRLLLTCRTTRRKKNEKRSENHDTQRIWSPVRQSTPNAGCPCVNGVTTSLHVATNIKLKLAKVVKVKQAHQKLRTVWTCPRKPGHRPHQRQ